jgi:hypothetical protein
VLAVSARNNSICTAHKQGCFCVKADAENIYRRGFSNTAVLISLSLSLMQLHYYNSLRRGTSPRPLFSFRHHQRTPHRRRRAEHKTRAPLLLFRTISLRFLRHSAKIDQRTTTRASSLCVYISLISVPIRIFSSSTLSVREILCALCCAPPHFSTLHGIHERGSSD